MKITREQALYGAKAFSDYFDRFETIADYMRDQKLNAVSDMPVGLPGLGPETDLFNERGRKIKSVKPKMGRCVVFDGSIKHRSSHPKNHNRCIINIDVTKFI